ncbi:MAG TPA: RnfH family protein [Noviherbaspirillum sp.]|nr:RnfH family protein [Noviherbaspirillum sp.]
MAEIRVQVCYARPGAQILREVTVPTGATLRAAIEQSGVLQDAPEIDLSVFRVGVFGKLKGLDTELREHDRIEIYRSLVADPKESRRRRAVKSDNKKAR